MTYHICCPTILPSFNSLYQAALSEIPQINIPNLQLPTFTIPSLPSLRSVIYSGLSVPRLEILKIIQEMQSFQLLSIFSAILTPITTFLGLGLNAILPKIPIINLNLLDLLSLNPNALYAAVESNLTNILSNLSSFPFIPNPLYFRFNDPQITLVALVQLILKGYMNSLMSTINSLIGQVTSILKVVGLPAIPSIPSLSSIESAIIAKAVALLPSYQNIQLPNIPSLQDVIFAGFPIETLIMSLSFSGFTIPTIPIPLIPTIASPDIVMKECMHQLVQEFMNAPLTIITNFCNTTISSLGFSFPKLCIDI